jgi:hypothetical protein
MKARKKKPEKTDGIVQPSLETEAEWSEHDRKDRTAKTG